MQGPITTHRADAEGRKWWHDAVFYRISPRSFADSSGNGVGDLNGIRQRLGYLELLGIDGIWLTTVLRAPVTGTSDDAYDVDPLLGDVESLELLVGEAHDCGIRVVIDVGVGRAGMDHPDNREELVRTVRYWLDRGVDGVRAYASPGAIAPGDDAVREIVRTIRPVVERYEDRVIGALIDGSWFRPDTPADLHLGLDVRFGDVGWSADGLTAVIDRMLSDARSLQITPVWGRAGRDQFHTITRYGTGTTGLARARAMLLVKLALPGMVGLENGEELGLPDADLPGRAGNDPIRGLMPWEGTQPPFGFSDAPGSWWPLTEAWAPYTVEAQLEDPDSTLSLYRHALEISSVHPAFQGDGIEWYGAPSGCFAFSRTASNLTCALNTSGAPVSLPSGEVLLSSSPLDGKRLPDDTAVWLVTSATEAARGDGEGQHRSESPSGSTNPSH